MCLPTREGVALLSEIFVLVVPRADALATPRYLILDALPKLTRDAEFSHARSGAVAKVVQSKVAEQSNPFAPKRALRLV